LVGHDEKKSKKNEIGKDLKRKSLSQGCMVGIKKNSLFIVYVSLWFAAAVSLVCR
jgi:hypothetical protein